MLGIKLLQIKTGLIMGLPLQSRWYFVNLVLSTILAVSTFGILWLATMPFKRLSNEFFRLGVLFILRTQIWLQGITDYQKLENPRGLYVANHRSILDTFILLALIPNLKLLAKKQLFTIPFLGILLRISKQIPIDIGDLNSIEQALATIEYYQSNNVPVLIYPEMTRCKPGFKGVQKFAQFPFNFAWSKNYFLTPIVLHNTDLAWPKGSFKIRKAVEIHIDVLPTEQSKEFSTPEDLKKYFHQKLSACIEARL